MSLHYALPSPTRNALNLPLILLRMLHQPLDVGRIPTVPFDESTPMTDGRGQLLHLVLIRLQ